MPGSNQVLEAVLPVGVISWKISGKVVKMLIMSSKGLTVVILNVELVAVAVMSVDLLQLGLVQGLVPGLVQVVAHLVHVVLGQGGAVQRVLGYGDHHSSSGVRSWTREQLQTSSATLLNQVLVIISNFKYYYPQRAQRAGGISKGLVISWSWLSLTTLVIARDKMWGKITKFYDNFEPPYLWTENSF